MSPDIYDQLADRIFCSGSRLVAELFRNIVNPEEAEILLATPGTAEQLAERLNYTTEDMEARLESLFHRGVIFRAPKPEGLQYRFSRDIAQFHDASILWPEAPREFLDLWKRYTEEEWPDYVKLVTNALPRGVARVITVRQPVEARSSILAYEDVEQIIMNAHPIAVVKCTCRHVDGKCGKPVEVCLQIGKGADYTLERGTGRELTREEAMEIIRQSEEAGLIHVVMNKSDTSHFICNCCEDCCIMMGLITRFGFGLCDPSRFLAVVDPEKCSACATCVDRCFFGAIELQDVNGREVSTVDAEKCMGCGLCSVTCPEEAMSMQECRQPDFIP
jgi:Pyruvate/2-oxoacid:ferredoxin oxidoreductase delta subunit